MPYGFRASREDSEEAQGPPVARMRLFVFVLFSIGVAIIPFFVFAQTGDIVAVSVVTAGVAFFLLLVALGLDLI
jgi:hypothetical protein